MANLNFGSTKGAHPHEVELDRQQDVISDRKICEIQRHALCRAIQSTPRVHREILTHGIDLFVERWTRESVSHRLSAEDLRDVFCWLNRNRPPWLHELPQGTILDEDHNIIRHPDAETLRGASRKLEALRGHPETIRMLRNLAIVRQDQEDERDAIRASASPSDPTF